MRKPTVAVARARFRTRWDQPRHQDEGSASGVATGFLIISSASSCARRRTHTRTGGSTSRGNSFATATMAAQSESNSRQGRHPAKCQRAASGSGARPSRSTAISTSLHCIALHSKRTTPGKLSRSTSFNSFRCNSLMFRREVACTPVRCAHCSSIVACHLRFRGMAFLSRLLAHFFLEQLAQTRARLVQLRLRISHGTSHNVCYLVVLVPLDVVQHKNRPVARRKLLNRSLQIGPVHRAPQAQILGANVFPCAACFLVWLPRSFQSLPPSRPLT